MAGLRCVLFFRERAESGVRQHATRPVYVYVGRELLGPQ
jgi:hypothetical protein